MKTRMITAAISIAAACTALAGDSPFTLVANPGVSCIPSTPGTTIPFQVSVTSAAATQDLHLTICSPASVINVVPSSSNVPAGGSLTSGTCSLGASSTFSALGSIPVNQTDTFAVAFAGPTHLNPTTPFQISVQDSTSAPVTTFVGLPECVVGPSLTIAKTANVKFAPRAGDIVEFDIVVTNVGTAPTSGNVTVTDSLPDGLQYQSEENGAFNSVTFHEDSNTLSFTDSSPIQPGASVECKIVCLVEDTNAFVNTATVHGGGAPDRTSAPASFKAWAPRDEPLRSPTAPLRDLGPPNRD